MIAAALAILVALAALALVAAAIHVNREIERLRACFDLLAGNINEAATLAGARARFRDRQLRVENAVTVGTVGAERAHRSLARRLGRPGPGSARLYAGIHWLNRGVGKLIGGVFAARKRPHKTVRSTRSDDGNNES